MSKNMIPQLLILPIIEFRNFTLGSWRVPQSIHCRYTPRVKIQASLTEYGIPLRIYEHGLTMPLRKERRDTDHYAIFGVSLVREFVSLVNATSLATISMQASEF